MQVFYRILLSGFLLFASLQGRAAEAEAKLHYQASYTGVLSLFQRLDIADVWYGSNAIGAAKNGDLLQHVTLSVSSENFSTVERLYPIRYQFQSIFKPETSQAVLFENLRTSKKSKKNRHKVGLFDLNDHQVQVYSSTNEQVSITPVQVKHLVDGGDSSVIVKQLNLKADKAPLHYLEGNSLIDRLTLLSVIRNQVIEGDEKRQYLVTNGRELMTYRVQLGKQELVQLGENKIKATKVKIEAFDFEKDNKSATGYVYAGDTSIDSYEALIQEGQQDYRHPPVYVWFSADDRRLPLKFVNHHALGEFVIELVNKT